MMAFELGIFCGGRHSKSTRLSDTRQKVVRCSSKRHRAKKHRVKDDLEMQYMDETKLPASWILILQSASASHFASVKRNDEVRLLEKAPIESGLCFTTLEIVSLVFMFLFRLIKLNTISILKLV